MNEVNIQDGDFTIFGDFLKTMVYFYLHLKLQK
jgi:hypothetical protein